MGIAIFILSIVGILGVFSLWQNSRKATIVNVVIQDYLQKKNAKLISTERPALSGPFGDAYYDAKKDNLYENIGYESKETIYREVVYELDGTQHLVWLQLRVESLKPVYTAWKKEA